jgi:K+/H+ antiporter YhaU regulatory subunit KhtT
MNTNIANLKKIGEEKYFDARQNKYTVFIAYEINKTNMFNFLKKQAQVNKTIDERQQAVIQKILDEELKKAEAADNGK